MAKDRLQFVLVHDRINLPPERLKEMKEEILAVISKYVAVDKDRVDIALEQRDRSSKIVAEFPFTQDRRLSLPIDEDEESAKEAKKADSALSIKAADTTEPTENSETKVVDKTNIDATDKPTEAPKPDA